MSFFAGNHKKENDKLTCRTAAVIFLSLANGLILLKTGLLWVSLYDHDASPFLQRIFNIFCSGLLSNSPRNRPFGYRFLKATCRLSFYVRFYSFLQYKPFSSLVGVLPEGAVDQEVDGSVQHEEQVIEPEINILGNLWRQIFIKGTVRRKLMRVESGINR
jgi:hypothetical protein